MERELASYPEEGAYAECGPPPAEVIKLTLVKLGRRKDNINALTMVRCLVTCSAGKKHDVMFEGSSEGYF